MTGGKDGVVVVWDMFFEHCLKAFRVERTVMNYGSILLDDCPPIRSIHTNASRILIGTGHNQACCCIIDAYYRHISRFKCLHFQVIEIEEDGKMSIITQVSCSDFLTNFFILY